MFRESTQRPTLSSEPRSGPLIELTGEDLERHDPIKVDLTGPIHHTERAAPDLLEVLEAWKP